MVFQIGDRITSYNINRKYRIFNPKSKPVRNGINFAYNLSFSSKIETGKHCAILLDKHWNVVDYFVNCYRNDGGIGSIHAEEGLVDRVSNRCDLGDCTIIVVRGNLLGEFSNSAPCDKCLKLILSSGIGRVVFTNRDNKLREYTMV